MMVFPCKDIKDATLTVDGKDYTIEALDSDKINALVDLRGPRNEFYYMFIKSDRSAKILPSCGKKWEEVKKWEAHAKG